MKSDLDERGLSRKPLPPLPIEHANEIPNHRLRGFPEDFPFGGNSFLDSSSSDIAGERIGSDMNIPTIPDEDDRDASGHHGSGLDVPSSVAAGPLGSSFMESYLDERGSPDTPLPSAGEHANEIRNHRLKDSPVDVPFGVSSFLDSSSGNSDSSGNDISEQRASDISGERIGRDMNIPTIPDEDDRDASGHHPNETSDIDTFFAAPETDNYPEMPVVERPSLGTIPPEEHKILSLDDHVRIMAWRDDVEKARFAETDNSVDSSVYNHPSITESPLSSLRDASSSSDISPVSTVSSSDISPVSTDSASSEETASNESSYRFSGDISSESSVAVSSEFAEESSIDSRPLSSVRDIPAISGLPSISDSPSIRDDENDTSSLGDYVTAGGSTDNENDVGEIFEETASNEGSDRLSVESRRSSYQSLLERQQSAEQQNRSRANQSDYGIV
jgi:hypothetical protein